MVEVETEVVEMDADVDLVEAGGRLMVTIALVGEPVLELELDEVLEV